MSVFFAWPEPSFVGKRIRFFCTDPPIGAPLATASVSVLPGQKGITQQLSCVSASAANSPGKVQQHYDTAVLGCGTRKEELRVKKPKVK